MTEHTLTPEFDYFHIDIDDLVAQAITGGGMMDCSDRARGAIAYMHRACEDRGDAFGARAWSMATEKYASLMMGEGPRYEYTSGVIQGDSLTDSPLQYWIIPMGPQNRGSISGYSYMVMWTEGYMVGQIDGAFMCDSFDVAHEIIHPTRAFADCESEDCKAKFIITEGCWLYAYDEESGMETGLRIEDYDYDADGIDCPVCHAQKLRAWLYIGD